MVDVSYQMVLSTIQTVSLVVGIVYYITIMRNQQRTRELSLKAQEEAEKSRKREVLFQRFQGYSMEYARAFANVIDQRDWQDPREWFEKYGRNVDPEAFASRLYMFNTFNFAGLLLREQMVDPELLFQLYPPNAIIPLWEQFEPVTNYVREDHKFPEYFEAFEYL